MASRSPPRDACEYETLNATTGCYTPRACTACLREPNCMINSVGICVAWPNVSSPNDYRNAIALNLTLPAAKDTMDATARRVIETWEFHGVKYCAASDTTCQQCVRENFWLPTGRPKDNRFCVGTDGCVCVLNCEGQSTGPVCPSSGSDPSLAETPAPTPTPTSVVNCRFSQFLQSDCFVYRSCRSCLETDGCRILKDGYCGAVDPNLETPRYDYHTAINTGVVLPAARTVNGSKLQSVQEWTFPASDLDYCQDNDTVCAECIHERYWQSEGAAVDSRFCVGADGCVCIANCARDDSAITCPSPVRDTERENSAEGTRMLVTIFEIGAIVFAIVGIIGAWFLFVAIRDRWRARRAQSAEPVVTPAVPLYERVEPSPPR